MFALTLRNLGQSMPEKEKLEVNFFGPLPSLTTFPKGSDAELGKYRTSHFGNLKPPYFQNSSQELHPSAPWWQIAITCCYSSLRGQTVPLPPLLNLQMRGDGHREREGEKDLHPHHSAWTPA